MARLTRDACEGACVRVHICHVGPMGNNCYLIENPADPADCFVVDPGFEGGFVAAQLDGRTPAAILLTHYHFDHTGAAERLRGATGAPVWMGEADAPYLAGEVPTPGAMWKVPRCEVDRRLADGEPLQLAGAVWTVIHTPGHSPGSICLFAEGGEGSVPVLIAGDTLFDGSIGRTDFADGSWPDMLASLQRLAGLPDETIVLTGHDSLTTIGALRRPVFARYAGIDQ